VHARASYLLVSLDHMLLRRALSNASLAVQENEARAMARRAAGQALAGGPTLAAPPPGRMGSGARLR
jgi:hypothetical protein